MSDGEDKSSMNRDRCVPDSKCTLKTCDSGHKKATDSKQTVIQPELKRSTRLSKANPKYTDSIVQEIQTISSYSQQRYH